ncbi:MAG TPA: class I SAM-dependent methyltransferase [Ramlibacter sp.]|uniref:class I SAM-dependent methyltransferase n=1 Tax=Ramlibacter sp. TaxID=1917967 RepID=UPI002ED1DFF2
MNDQRHKYEYKVKRHTAADKVVNMVGSDKRVLELGPGPGSITRLLKDNNCRVTALELDAKAIEIVSEYCESVHPCNLNDADWPTKLPGAGKFDVIVAGDVLEHLYDPWAVLGALPSLLADDGYVVLSLPHIGHNAAIACLLAGNFEYQPWGLLDKTHIRFFGIANIQKLFENAGFKIVDAGFVTKSPEQTEFSRQWSQLPAETRQALAANRFGTIYQVVVKAVPRHAEGKGLQLASLPIPSPLAMTFSERAQGNPVLRFLVSLLGPRTRQRISRGLERLGIRT